MEQPEARAHDSGHDRQVRLAALSVPGNGQATRKAPNSRTGRCREGCASRKGMLGEADGSVGIAESGRESLKRLATREWSAEIQQIRSVSHAI